MCLDYLWVSNLYGPSTTQPRPKIKTFLGAQDTLILFNVPAPYAPKTQLFTQRLFTKTALPARETCILMHIGRRIDCRKVLCEKPRSAEAAFGCRAGLKWLQKARMLCCTRGSLCHFQFRTSGRPCGAQDMLLLINLSICVLCVLSALCALLQIT